MSEPWTPGPWTWSAVTVEPYALYGIDSDKVLGIAWAIEGQTFEVGEADARLIALAPEMATELALGLKIMRGLEELGNIVTDGPSWSDRVAALLARARGEEQVS